ncbi:MAG: hypothetical protein AAFP69_01850 [Planctomycetota bacterium]
MIEPRANQLLGALLQWISLRDHPAVSGQTLGVVKRRPGAAETIVDLAKRLGMRALACCPHPVNVFMNRWSILDEDRKLATKDALLLLDWDVVYVGRKPNTDQWPDVADGKVSARRNPADLYRSFAKRLSNVHPDAPITCDGDLQCSINGGVLITAGDTAERLRARHQTWLARIAKLAEPEAWQWEQCALSLAVGDLGYHRIGDPWNATPASPVLDDEIQLWHYNDGDPRSRKIKRRLLDATSVWHCCNLLRKDFPQTIARFHEHYQTAVSHGMIRPFMETDPSRDDEIV